MRERLRTKFDFRALGVSVVHPEVESEACHPDRAFHTGDLVIIPSDNADPLPISRAAVDPLD